ncbi:rRNA maturation protein [Ophiocordyceps camponoti-floridani]|uniref:rRNA maturation protein n=1 Tax=Ophiocordyceps camponoti-floridani TaxID=2030778 RepID=A0A8H4VG35_9HYPO|nr:rRNA maturation protein [Ophiocordyceps camponoti-floridani]
MAGSQLKRLKASLREQGITGPQQSKKQKRKAAQDSRARGEKKLQRGLVLDSIRQQFNPFDLKHAARGPKFEVTTNRPATGDAARGIRGRPTQARAAGEERRRQNLLVEMQRRNKVGGILDRRFGENDPTMTPEQKMLERFALEKQRSHNKSSLFDLEDDDASGVELTHMGKSLTFGDEPVDDFNEEDLDAADDSDVSVRERQRLKRVRSMAAGAGEEEAEQPERKKSKKEVMQEIIAKSKMHKYERQAAKEDDDEMRAELDKELSEIQVLLSTAKGGKGADLAEAPLSTIAGTDRNAFDKNYDLQVKRLAQDRRAQPTERTKTDEERAAEESEKLQKLEERRRKRMWGEEVSDSESSEDEGNKGGDEAGATALEDDDEDEFGLGKGLKTRPTATELGFDDEDDFLIDDNLVASGSDLEPVDSDEEDENGSDQEGKAYEDEDDEFTKGLLNEEEARDAIFTSGSDPKAADRPKSGDEGLPFTFACPQSCQEFDTMTQAFPRSSLPTVVQRVRALYHPKLDSGNKEKLAGFAVALVDFVAMPWAEKTSPPFSVMESLVRHIHSLAKMFPVEIGNRFRHHIGKMGGEGRLALEPSDIIVLTAVGTIFPTSDHFHQVATPAMLVMAWYLGQCVPRKTSDYVVGLFLSILALQYQQLSKRYVPEVMNFCLNTLCALSPVGPAEQLGNFPQHEPPPGTRIQDAKAIAARRLRLGDCVAGRVEGDQAASLKVAIFDTCVRVVEGAAELWSGKSAFLETFEQAVKVIRHSRSEVCRTHLPAELLDRADKVEAKAARMLRLAQLSRRPLELHHHRPLAIKTFVPKFEETFDPSKHYDPDRERAELAKLRAEHKKERKGLMRELRRDANFMAREKLRVKKAKDEAYEKKYKRLIAEIQGEEGREANAYEREKQARKRANKR